MEDKIIENFKCEVKLPDWRLHLAQMTAYHWRDLGNVMDLATKGAIKEIERYFPEKKISLNSVIASIRASLDKLGHDWKKNPPSSEILISEIIEKMAFPRGCLAWEFLAILIIRSCAPWSVMDRKTLKPPLVFRSGKAGEKLSEIGGDVDCQGLPVLVDQEKVVASPWTGISRYDLEGCELPLFVCFLPKELFRKIQPKTHVGRVVWLTWAYKFIFEKSCAGK